MTAAINLGGNVGMMRWTVDKPHPLSSTAIVREIIDDPEPVNEIVCEIHSEKPDHSWIIDAVFKNGLVTGAVLTPEAYAQLQADNASTEGGEG